MGEDSCFNARDVFPLAYAGAAHSLITAGRDQWCRHRAQPGRWPDRGEHHFVHEVLRTCWAVHPPFPPVPAWPLLRCAPLLAVTNRVGACGAQIDGSHPRPALTSVAFHVTCYALQSAQGAAAADGGPGSVQDQAMVIISEDKCINVQCHPFDDRDDESENDAEEEDAASGAGSDAGDSDDEEHGTYLTVRCSAHALYDNCRMCAREACACCIVNQWKFAAKLHFWANKLSARACHKRPAPMAGFEV